MIYVVKPGTVDTILGVICLLAGIGLAVAVVLLYRYIDEADEEAEE